MTREEIIEKLCNAGYDTYVVGGAVRDLLRGVSPHDEDIVTSATPDEIINLFASKKVKVVGKSFNVVLVDGIDVATFRQDRYIGLSDKKVDIQTAKSIQDDLSRRDLTFNALAFCQQTGDIVDLFGGINDLKNKTIKFVGNPEKRIYEDPNRIIRACRFLALIEGHFHPETQDALIKYGHYVRDYVAPERIRLEIYKVMPAKRASLFFRALRSIGVLQYIFPSLDCCVDFEHGPYHIEDVFEHNMHCGDNISPRCTLLRLSAYLHDVGKPFVCTYNPKTHDLSFKGHDKDGAERVRQELKNLKFFKNEISYITTMIQLHMRFLEESMSPKAIRRTLQKLHEANIYYSDLIRLRLADRRANLKKGPYPLETVKKLVQIIEQEVVRGNPNTYKDLALNGNDIMEITGFTPGSIIGQILQFLFDQVIENPAYNTKEQLTELVKDYLCE